MQPLTPEELEELKAIPAPELDGLELDLENLDSLPLDLDSIELDLESIDLEADLRKLDVEIEKLKDFSIDLSPL